MYPGIKGRTQGEKKERAPNINAIDKFTSMLFNPLTPIFTTNRAYIFFM